MDSRLYEDYYMLRRGVFTVGCMKITICLGEQYAQWAVYEDYYILRFVYAQWVV